MTSTPTMKRWPVCSAVTPIREPITGDPLRVLGDYGSSESVEQSAPVDHRAEGYCLGKCGQRLGSRHQATAIPLSRSDAGRLLPEDRVGEARNPGSPIDLYELAARRFDAVCWSPWRSRGGLRPGSWQCWRTRLAPRTPCAGVRGLSRGCASASATGLGHTWLAPRSPRVGVRGAAAVALGLATGCADVRG